MRRFTAVLVVVFLSLFAAESAEAQNRLGFRGGLSLSDLSIDSDEPIEFDRSTSIIVGAFLDVPLSGNLSFQPGLNWVGKGAEQEDDGFTAEIELDYLEIPALLQYTFPSSGSVAFSVRGGPAVAFEIGCEVSFEGDGIDESEDCDTGDPDESIETKSVDFGLLFGAGLAFDLAGPAVHVDAGYALGLTNISDSSDEGDSAKNRAIYLTVGLSFPVGN